MTLDDKFIKGFISGIAAGLTNNAITLYSYYMLKFTNTRWLDWSASTKYPYRNINHEKNRQQLFFQQ